MAPYDPPNSHYSQYNVSDIPEDEMFKIMGKGGKKFYWLTNFLGLDYIWYDKHRKVIELWGPFESLQNFQAHHILECEINLSREKLFNNQLKNEQSKETNDKNTREAGSLCET